MSLPGPGSGYVKLMAGPRPLAQAWAVLSWGSDQNVIVYTPRACTKKNLESIPPIILVLGHIFLVFGHFEPLQALFEPP